MSRPTKREQLAAMRLEEFKAHLPTIAGEDPNAAITDAARPHPSLVRNGQEGSASCKAKAALSIPDIRDRARVSRAVSSICWHVKEIIT
jgi:hypothetical protein